MAAKPTAKVTMLSPLPASFENIAISANTPPIPSKALIIVSGLKLPNNFTA